MALLPVPVPHPIVYVTGFGPFGNHKENASQKVVDNLKNTNLGSELNVDLITDIYDVDYSLVLKNLPSKWKNLKPKLVVHVGVSSFSKNVVQLECRAKNNDYKQQDLSNCIPSTYKCLKGSSNDVLYTNLDVGEVVNKVRTTFKTRDLEIDSSNDPGGYLCSYIYYLSLSICPKRCIFIHIPPLEQVSEDVSEALSTLTDILAFIVKCLYKQVQDLSDEDDDNCCDNVICQAEANLPLIVPNMRLNT